MLDRPALVGQRARAPLRSGFLSANDTIRQPSFELPAMAGPWRWLPFVFLTGVYLLALSIPVIDVDSAQYAHVALEMLQTKSFLVVHNRGMDYLDKPPLTFWLEALSFGAFGASTWAYKLPSVLFALLAIFSTWRLARLVLPERVAWAAALMLASTTAMLLWTNDVRTDTILTGATTFAAWQLAAWSRTRSGAHATLGFAGIGVAMLAKGPIGAVVPLSALCGDALLRREWRRLLTPWWAAGAGICLLVLSPMLWGLYRQYGVSGWTFFFWTQSFGRITGSSSWHDTTTPLFFTHTVLWELLPWTPFFLFGFCVDCLASGRAWRRRECPKESFSLPGFCVPFVALSLSHYKLPHYLFLLLPFACIIAAKQLERMLSPTGLFRSAFLLQGVLLGGVWFILLWLLLVGFPGGSAALFGALAACAGATLWLSLPRYARSTRLLGPSLATALAMGLLMNGQLYPALLRYESSTTAADVLQAEGAPPERVLAYRIHPYSLDFLLRRTVPELTGSSALPPLLRAGDAWIYTDEAGKDELAGIADASIVGTVALEDFPISRLHLMFLRPATRHSWLSRRYLVQVRGH
jgi:4-amino-4-deoxy-L-arabinose transferase-like glycosyltransferase